MAKQQMNEFMISSNLKTDTKSTLGRVRNLRKKLKEAEGDVELGEFGTEPDDSFGAEVDTTTIEEPGEGMDAGLKGEVMDLLNQIEVLLGADEGEEAAETAEFSEEPADVLEPVEDNELNKIESKKMSIDKMIAEQTAKRKVDPKLIERVTADIIKEANNLDIRTSAKLGGSGDSGNVTFDGAGNLNTRDVSNMNKVTQPPSSAGAQHDLDTPADRRPGFDGIQGVPKAGSGRHLTSNGGDLGSVQESSLNEDRDTNTIRNPKAVAPGSFVVIYRKGTLEKVDSGVVHKVTNKSLTLEGEQEYDMSSHDYRTLAT